MIFNCTGVVHSGMYKNVAQHNLYNKTDTMSDTMWLNWQPRLKDSKYTRVEHLQEVVIVMIQFNTHQTAMKDF